MPRPGLWPCVVHGWRRAARVVGVATIGLSLATMAGAQSVQDLTFHVQDMALQMRDMPFQARDLDFTTRELRVDVQHLRFEVEDFAAPDTTERELRFRLSADVLFDFDSAELRPEAKSVLNGLAAKIQAEFPTEVVRVEGYTDSKGSDRYNQELSERRAESVANWFVEHGGIEEERVVTRGFGEAQPVASNQRSDGSDDPVGRQQNRRVEVVVERSG